MPASDLARVGGGFGPSAKRPLRVAVTGAAGRIGYSLCFRIAGGDMFGPQQPVHLSLLETEEASHRLDGLAMELDDSAFPLLAGIDLTTSAEQAFDGAVWVLMIGAAPRRTGMERRDLLSINAAIFAEQGAALGGADADVQALVVGNPANTNCLIARSHGERAGIPRSRFYSLMALDQSRARSRIAARAGVPVEVVTNLAVWGNHSSTQFPDGRNALIGGRPAGEVVDPDWLANDLVVDVAHRGAAVLAAQGQSSAGSAAEAIIHTVIGLSTPTRPGDCVAVAVPSPGDYGVAEGLQFGLPVVVGEDGWEVAPGFRLDEPAQKRLNASAAELIDEAREVDHLLPHP
jgi:malate dehydrogenase